MFGLVILFFLGLWILITIIATVAGARKKGSKGAFIGFMLTMGGPIVYWAFEYYQTQSQITQLCNSDSGLTVYVTPEEYKQRLKNNNWENIPKVDINKESEAFFDNKEFVRFSKENNRIAIFYRNIHHNGFYINQELYVDTKTSLILARFSSVNLVMTNDLTSLKLWRSNIKDCKGKHLNQSLGKLLVNYKGVV